MTQSETYEILFFSYLFPLIIKPNKPLLFKAFSETNLSLLNFSTGEGNGTPLQYSCLENPMDGRAWWAAVYRVTESDTTEAT